MAEFTSMNRDVTCIRKRGFRGSGSEKCRTNIIELTNGNVLLPVYRETQKTNKESEIEEHESASANPTAGTCNTLADVIPDNVKDARELDDRVLAMSSIEDPLEMESYSGNIGEEEWVNELEKCHDEFYEDDPNASTGNEDEPVNHGKTGIANQKDKNLVTSTMSLDINDMECLLRLFKTTQNCNKKGKWNTVTPAELLEYFKSTGTLNTFLDTELRALVRYLKKTKKCNIKESSPKYVKVLELSTILGLECDQVIRQRTTKGKQRQQTAKKLSELSATVVSKLPKQCLNIIYAELIWQERFEAWASDTEGVTVEGSQYDWFYRPEYSLERDQYEVRCIDATHLLTRTRSKVCKGGIEGLTNESWSTVAQSGKTLLTPVMVTEIIDPMSVSRAVTHFSEQVETVLRANGELRSADLCRDIRLMVGSRGLPRNQFKGKTPPQVKPKKETLELHKL